MQGSYQNKGLPRPYYMKPNKRGSAYDKQPRNFFLTNSRKLTGYLIMLAMFGLCMYMVAQELKPHREAPFEVAHVLEVKGTQNNGDVGKLVDSADKKDTNFEKPQVAVNKAQNSRGEYGHAVMEAPKGGLVNEGPVVGADEGLVVDGNVKKSKPGTVRGVPNGMGNIAKANADSDTGKGDKSEEKEDIAKGKEDIAKGKAGIAKGKEDIANENEDVPKGGIRGNTNGNAKADSGLGVKADRDQDKDLQKRNDAAGNAKPMKINNNVAPNDENGARAEAAAAKIAKDVKNRMDKKANARRKPQEDSPSKGKAVYADEELAKEDGKAVYADEELSKGKGSVSKEPAKEVKEDVKDEKKEKDDVKIEKKEKDDVKIEKKEKEDVKIEKKRKEDKVENEEKAENEEKEKNEETEENEKTEEKKETEKNDDNEALK